MRNERKKMIYLRRVGQALSVCQLIEAILKIYVRTAFKKIGEALDDRLPFGFTSSDCEDRAMEGLLKLFRKLSDHQALIKRLEAFKRERNYVAHRAIMEYVMCDPADSKKHRELTRRLERLQDDGYLLLRELQVELRRIEIAAPPALYDYVSPRKVR